MDALDYILDGLEAELALERELGVRSFEIDRALLTPVAAPSEAAVPPLQKKEAGPSAGSDRVVAATPPPAVRPVPQPPTVVPQRANPPTRQPAGLPALDFVFLHDKPLSAKGIEMMAKIIVALGKTAETAPVVITPPAPPAKIRIVLGGLALKKWFPGRNVSPGQWFTDEKGGDVLVTYTPEYILRFGTITPALQKIKQDMWNSLKSVLKRV